MDTGAGPGQVVEPAAGAPTLAAATGPAAAPARDTPGGGSDARAGLGDRWAGPDKI
jgi:hypothetical protein